MLTLLSLLCALGGQEPALVAEPVPESLELVGGRVYDGEDFVARTLFVEDGVFTERRPTGDVRRVELDGGFVVPPFGDAHNHRFAGADDGEASRAMYLERGFCYVGNLCGPATARADTAPWTNRPSGVDVVFTNGALTARGSHPVPLYRTLHERRGAPADTFLARNDDNTFYQVDDELSLRAKLGFLFATRPDLVKFMLSQELDPALVPLLVEAAHARGLRVVCHLDTAAQFRVAVAAGVDLLAHTPGYGVRVGEDVDAHRLNAADARAAAQAGLTVMTTAGAYEDREDNSAARAALKHNLGLLRDAGVTIAFGCDDWFGPDAELRALRDLGVFDAAVLVRMLCVDTPRALYPERKIGRLDARAEGSLVVLASNPLLDLDALAEVRMVVKQGAVLLDAPER